MYNIYYLVAWRDAMVAFSHETCFECKHRSVSQVPGWVITRGLTGESPSHVHTLFPIQPSPPLLQKQIMA